MPNFVIETSARHVHVTREALDILFGKGFELEVKKPLSQPGQYASNQKVEVIGPKGSLKCSILGPVRPENQVELSFTDVLLTGRENTHWNIQMRQTVCSLALWVMWLRRLPCRTSGLRS